MEEEFDGYECIPQEQFLIRRLLAFMRSSQNLCTDTFCIDDATPPGSRSSNNNNDDGNYVMITMIMMLLALVMCFVRPDSFMKVKHSKRPMQQGSNGDDQNQQPPPPPPPPAIN